MRSSPPPSERHGPHSRPASTQTPAGRQRRSRPARAPRAPVRPRPDAFEVTFLPGLADLVHDEVVAALAPPRPPRPVPGRDDALAVTLPGWDRRVLDLRTAVAVWLVSRHDVPRPGSLTSPQHLAAIAAAMRASLATSASRAFRFEAAGADSAAFARLGAALADAVGLPFAPGEGELVVRVRRGATGGPGDPGWDVLVRVGPRPLSVRAWRVADYPGALNATIAAAMVALAGRRDHDRVLNLMCGSGTLLVELLLAGPAPTAVGVDLDDRALDAARANLGAARVRATLARADATDPAAVQAALLRCGAGEPAARPAADAAGPAAFDLLLADPPWGDLHGTHAGAPALHAGLLRTAHALAAPGARFVVVTHEVAVMTRALREVDALWRADEPRRVFAKGHHPRIWLLHRR